MSNQEEIQRKRIEAYLRSNNRRYKKIGQRLLHAVGLNYYIGLWFINSSKSRIILMSCYDTFKSLEDKIEKEQIDGIKFKTYEILPGKFRRSKETIENGEIKIK